MRLQKASHLALYAILELAAAPDQQLTSADIADKYGISINHLSKIMRTLVRVGLVESVRGAKGGFCFVGNARRTTLMDVIELFETVGETPGRAREAGEQTEAGRAIREVLDEIDEIAQATLRSITIATMFKVIERQRSRAQLASAGAAAAGDAS